jgi:hypothetical protein
MIFAQVCQVKTNWYGWRRWLRLGREDLESPEGGWIWRPGQSDASACSTSLSSCAPKRACRLLLRVHCDTGKMAAAEAARRRPLYPRHAEVGSAFFAEGRTSATDTGATGRMFTFRRQQIRFQTLTLSTTAVQQPLALVLFLLRSKRPPPSRDGGARRTP